MWRVGPLTVYGPERQRDSGTGVTWTVMAVDSMTEETSEKVFRTHGQAQAFIDTLVNGTAPVDPLADEPGTPPKNQALVLRAPTGAKPAPPTLNGHHVSIDRRAGHTLATHGASAPFNISAVADALIAEELDPFTEIARAIKDVETVYRNGNPVIGADGQPVTKRVIGSLDRAKILVDLGQYLQPKLKAMEVKVENKNTLTAEQLDERIAAIMERSAATQVYEQPTEDAGR